MRRRGRDRYRPAQARLDADLRRYDIVQRTLGHGAPVKHVDIETGTLSWRRPLSAAPVIRDGALVGISVAWVTCEPPVGDRVIDNVFVTGKVQI